MVSSFVPGHWKEIVMSTFDPEYLTPESSLNRVVLQDLPEHDIPSKFKGCRGYDLISTMALDNLLSNAGFLQKDETAPAARNRFYQLLEARDPYAVGVAQQLGIRFGLLLLTLHRGDEVNRAARPEWSSAHWDYWAAIQEVIIGGGLANGHLGHIIAEEAQQILRNTTPEYRVRVSRQSLYLPLLGAARYVPEGEDAIVFDFGGTNIKRGRAIYRNNLLCDLEILPSIPSQWQATDPPEIILSKMVELIVGTIDVMPHMRYIPISIASYVDRAGTPMDAQRGIYMKLKQLGDNTTELLSDHIATKVCRPITVRLLHDGTAAASLYSPRLNSAVLTLGTALGVGFPVRRLGLRQVEPALQELQ
jgi:hypothetical protein